MKIILFLGMIVFAAVLTFAQDVHWKIQGKGITTDNCAIGCPCLLGEPPTHGRCQFTGILLIENGHYGDVNLDNTKIAIGGAFGRSKEMGEKEPDFVVYYIDASASDEQKDALRKLISGPAFAGFGVPKEINEMPITLTGTENFGKVGQTYGGTIGDIAKIEITPVGGAAKDQPLVIENSAEPLFDWTALGKSSNSYFKGAGVDWTFNGTSGESQHFFMTSDRMTGMDHMEHHMNMEQH